MPNSQHLHVQTNYFIYPMYLSHEITYEFLQNIFEQIHMKKLIAIPRLLLYSIKFKCKDSIIIYTHSNCTEIAVIVDNTIHKDQWCVANFFHEDHKNATQDQVDESELGICTRSIYNLQPSFQFNCFQNNQSAPTAHLIKEEFCKKIRLANIIQHLVQGLSSAILNQLLQAVFLIGKIFFNISNSVKPPGL